MSAKAFRLTVVVALAALGGCDRSRPLADAVAPAPASAPTSGEQGATGAHAVDSLGLEFVLPPSFVAADHDTLAFLARSYSPPAIFSIQGDASGVVEHEPEEGERLASVDVGAGRAVVVHDAVLEGLAPGLEAKELLVTNGSKSFTAIMSGPAEEIDALWRVFIRSVRVGEG